MISKKYISKIIALSLIMFASVLVGCSDDSTKSNTTSDSDNSGGQLKVALESQPNTLDPLMSSAVVRARVAQNIFESLVTLNSDFEPTPMLAESIEQSEDGLTYTFHLRKGVNFHNGKEMTAEDVLASMNRWAEKSTQALAYFEGITFEMEDDYTVIMKLKEKYKDILVFLAERDDSSIMPKEVIESEETTGVTEYIGTGPFKFDDWKQDQYIKLSKFEDYTQSDLPTDGLSGKKEALVDDLYFYFVTDTSTRLMGLKTGEYDIVNFLPEDNYEELKSDPNINTLISYKGAIEISFNKKEGLFSDFKMREAVNTAVDAEMIMKSTYPDEDLYKLNPGYINDQIVNWYVDAGKEKYNQGDPEKARELLEEAGYDGEEITVLSTRDYDYNYNTAVILQQQLEEAGMNVKIEIYDWSSLLDLQHDPGVWDISILGPDYKTSPPQMLALDPKWPGWTDDPKITDLKDKIRTAETQEQAKAHWETLQEFLWTEYLPISRVGDYAVIVGTTDKVEGFKVFDSPGGYIFWNTKVSE
ncbi:ABC transporter substrate-binding protein [Ornithinibacillus sp. 4-3]|uniref:ABC transporter substrate-binding protein n=1 Tax=Ornithinibacillus sp. 4-3 TaxID=3231488 RepID=A0AB39HMX7_9BACI